MTLPSRAPLLLRDTIDDLDEVMGLFIRNAPYTPLGGWYRPDHAQGEATSPMWFQKDWVHADFSAEGSELFFWNERFMEAARQFYSAKEIVPRSVYVNLMISLNESGPAHTDNPTFRGRDRTNTPMMLLRVMVASGLFDRWQIVQATSIWWMNDVEGGGFSYWAHGPGQGPERHVGDMANTALVGDNHGMYHQVEPVGPFLEKTPLVTPAAELAPVAGGQDDWAVTDLGKECFRAPFAQLRASVLWKADVYADEAERRELAADVISMDDVVRIFNEDLAVRGEGFRLDREALEKHTGVAELAAIYPEPVPVGAGRSIFDL